MPDPKARLSRRETAAALTEAGYPTAPSTLATLACRGGGPAYVIFNGRAFYTFGDALEWARSRTSEPHTTAAERRAAARAPPRATNRPRELCPAKSGAPRQPDARLATGRGL